MTPFFSKFLQAIKNLISGTTLIANILLDLAWLNLSLLFTTIIPLSLINGITLIVRVIFALGEMTLFILFLSLKPLPGKIKAGIKAFFAFSKAALYSLTAGIILTTRVIFALIRFGLFLLFLIARAIFAKVSAATKVFYALIRTALRVLGRGIKAILAGIKSAAKAIYQFIKTVLHVLGKGINALLAEIKTVAKSFYELIKAALRALSRGIKTLVARIKAASKIFYAFIKTVLRSIYKGLIVLVAEIKAAARAFFTFIKVVLQSIYEGIKAIFAGLISTAKAFFTFIKIALQSIYEGFRAIFTGIKAVIKNALSGTNKFISGIRKQLALRVKIFYFKQKLSLHKVNKRVKKSQLVNKPKQYALLIRLDKPIGILLLLWPTLMALWIAAGGWPDTDVLLVFVAGVFLMRSAGCAINDYADRDIDCKVARTKDRPLTSGKISEKEALIVFAVLCLTAFGLVLLMNPLTIVMSLGGLILAASYPFMKRHHYLPQVHLGAAFGWAVPMAYAAQTNELNPVAWLLFIATVLWATAYDTMYAMVDREDDLKIGVKSTAILFEDADKLIIGIIQGTLILCLIMIGLNAELGIFYYTGVLLATGLAIWQQHLIRHREPAQCFKAFLNNNWFGLVLFAGVFLEYQIAGTTS